MTSLVSYDTDRSGDPQTFEQQNRRISKLSDQEAMSLVQGRQAATGEGRDPTQLQLERQWFRNVAYYLGLNADTFIGAGLDEDTDVVRDLGYQQYTANHIFRIVRAELSRLSSARPDWDVIPKSSDQRDRFGAKVAQHHLDHYYERFSLRKKRTELAMWAAVTGSAFMYVGWDERKGKRHRVYRDPFSGDILGGMAIDKSTTKDFLDATQSFEEFHEGDFDVDVVSPFQVRTPIGPTRLEDMPWVTITRLRSLDWIWEHYPEKAKHIQAAERNASTDSWYWRRLSTMVNGMGVTYPARGSIWTEGIEVHEHWVPAYGRWENGARIVATSNMLLENGPNPLAEAGLDYQYPIAMCRYAELPGRFWGMSLVEQLVPIQDDYNIGRRQLIIQRDVLSKPQWLVSRQADITQTRNVTGDIWEYDGDRKPELQSPPQVSPAHITTRDHTLADMQTISAYSDPSLGQVPQGVRSGVAIKALQEKDEAVMGSTIEELEHCFHETAEMFLKLTSKFVRIPKMVEVYGENRQADIQFFKGSDLNDNTTVRIVPGSMMPKSKAGTQQLLLDLLQLGAIDPMNPDVQREILDAFEFGGVDQMFAERDLDRRRARIENEMFANPDPGQMQFPDVDEDDDHEVHLKEHLLLKKTDAYEMWPEMRRMAFEAHMAKHKAALAAMLEAQMMAQAAMAGPGSGEGGGSPPKEPGQASPPAKKNPTPGTDPGNPKGTSSGG